MIFRKKLIFCYLINNVDGITIKYLELIK